MSVTRSKLGASWRVTVMAWVACVLVAGCGSSTGSHTPGTTSARLSQSTSTAASPSTAKSPARAAGPGASSGIHAVYRRIVPGEGVESVIYDLAGGSYADHAVCVSGPCSTVSLATLIVTPSKVAFCAVAKKCIIVSAQNQSAKVIGFADQGYLFYPSGLARSILKNIALAATSTTYHGMPLNCFTAAADINGDSIRYCDLVHPRILERYVETGKTPENYTLTDFSPSGSASAFVPSQPG
jgi:hypothetical protein